MIYDSLQILEGSKIINTTVESGASFPANPNEGQLFFKTDVSKMYVYNGTSWAEIVKAAESASAVPRMASVAVTNSSYIETNENIVNTAGGFIKITGFGFVAGCTVLVGRLPATSVSRVSAEELRVQVPAQSSGNYPLYVVNPDGGTGIFITGITYLQE